MSNAFGFYLFKGIFSHDSKQSPRALLGAILVPEAWLKVPVISGAPVGTGRKEKG